MPTPHQAAKPGGSNAACELCQGECQWNVKVSSSQGWGRREKAEKKRRRYQEGPARASIPSHRAWGCPVNTGHCQGD